MTLGVGQREGAQYVDPRHQGSCLVRERLRPFERRDAGPPCLCPQNDRHHNARPDDEMAARAHALWSAGEGAWEYV